MREIRRILFVRTDRMGDVLMNLPAIHLLRQTYPKAWICLFVDEAVEGLFRAHPDPDELMTADGARLKRSLRYRLECVSRLRRARFDLALVSNPDRHLHCMVFLAGIKRRVGYRRKWPFFLTDTLSDRGGSEGHHEFERNLRLASTVSDGLEWDGQCQLVADAMASQKVGDRLSSVLRPGQRVVAIHAGTSHPGKRWNPDRFAVVCRWTADRGFLPILIGGAEEKGISATVSSKSGVGPADWTGVLSLEELVGLFQDRRVAALVSSDSGPVHVAWISGTPVVALYAKDVPGSDPARWGPRDKRSEVLYKPIASITAEEVCGKLERVLESP